MSIAVHLSLIVSGRGSSHITLAFQMSWSNILALTVTGVTHPNVVCKMYLLVMNVLIAGNFLVESEIMSVTVQSEA